MNGVIEAYVGPEGSGKTLLLTTYAARCKIAGMEMMAFPGYALLDKHGATVTKEITPLDFLIHFQEMQNVCLCITEITNYGIDAYNFNGIIPRIFGNAAAMRRKLGLVILYDVQNFSMIPPRIRFFTHTICFCRDMFFGHQYTDTPIERGKNIQFRRMDMKGFYTGREGWLGRTTFLNNAESVWPLYKTTGMVDAKWMLKSYKKSDLLPMFDDTATPQGFELPEGMDREQFIKQNLQGVNYRLSDQDTETLIVDWINEVKNQGLAELPVQEVMERLKLLGIKAPINKIGHIIKTNGVRIKRNPNCSFYVFDN